MHKSKQNNKSKQNINNTKNKERDSLLWGPKGHDSKHPQGLRRKTHFTEASFFKKKAFFERGLPSQYHPKTCFTNWQLVSPKNVCFI